MKRRRKRSGANDCRRKCPRCGRRRRFRSTEQSKHKRWGVIDGKPACYACVSTPATADGAS